MAVSLLVLCDTWNRRPTDRDSSKIRAAAREEKNVALGNRTLYFSSRGLENN